MTQNLFSFLILKNILNVYNYNADPGSYLHSVCDSTGTNGFREFLSNIFLRIFCIIIHRFCKDLFAKSKLVKGQKHETFELWVLHKS
jgi:hypothetical protein